MSPHVLRRSTATELLQRGVDRSVIALWLGHESMETTRMYLDANLGLKETVLATTTPFQVRPGHYRPDDRVLPEVPYPRTPRPPAGGPHP